MNSNNKKYLPALAAQPNAALAKGQPQKVNIKSKFSALNLKRPAEEVHVPFSKKFIQPTNEKPNEQQQQQQQQPQPVFRNVTQPNADLQSSYQMCMQAQAQMARMHKPLVISLPHEPPSGNSTVPYKITISIPTDKPAIAGAPPIPLPPLTTVPMPPLTVSMPIALAMPPLTVSMPPLSIPLPATSVKPITASISLPTATITSNQPKLLKPIEQIDHMPTTAIMQPSTMQAATNPMSACHINREALLAHLNAAFGRLEFLLPISDDVVNLLAFAAQDYIKGIIEQVIDIAKHRCDSGDFNSSTSKITNDVRSKFEFLNKFVNHLSNREDETISESLSDIEDRRAYKLRKTQEQQIQLANQTAMAAIGLNTRKAEEILPRKMAKKFKVITKDVIFFMENDAKFAKSEMLYKAYEKYD